MYLYRGGGCRPHISLCRLWAENAHLQDVREAVFDGQEKLNKNIELSLGFIPLRMAKTVTAFIDEPEVQETRQYLDRVSRVDVGVYEVQGSLNSKRSAVAQRVQASMEAHGFEPVVIVREKRKPLAFMRLPRKTNFLMSYLLWSWQSGKWCWLDCAENSRTSS